MNVNINLPRMNLVAAVKDELSGGGSGLPSKPAKMITCPKCGGDGGYPNPDAEEFARGVHWFPCYHCGTTGKVKVCYWIDKDVTDDGVSYMVFESDGHKRGKCIGEFLGDEPELHEMMRYAEEPHNLDWRG